MFGFGVNEKGEEKLETCLSKCQAGKVGSGNGQFFKPTGIGVSGGDVYVVDSDNDRVQEFSGGLYITYVAKFGTKGSGEVQFSAPGGMAIDSSGNLYIADTANNRIEDAPPAARTSRSSAKRARATTNSKNPKAWPLPQRVKPTWRTAKTIACRSGSRAWAPAVLTTPRRLLQRRY